MGATNELDPMVCALRLLVDTVTREYNDNRMRITIQEFDNLLAILERLEPDAYELWYRHLIKRD